MINIDDQLTILHSDNGTFSDYTRECSQFGKDSTTLTITALEDYIYIGFNKPINAFYVNIATANGVAGELTIESYNGTTWASVEKPSDDTLGFFRSGFVRWQRAITAYANEVNSESKYWYRITLDTNRTAMVIKGINLIFSDDYELSLEQPYISSAEFLGNESSHIKIHAAVKNEIIQKFRNKNYIKFDYVSGDKEDINVWDLLDINEVKLAATYLALYKIYNHLSDDPEDSWAVKAKRYEESFEKYIQIARLSVDVNDDGITSVGENKSYVSSRYITR